jgi:hypothetical protein
MADIESDLLITPPDFIERTTNRAFQEFIAKAHRLDSISEPINGSN